LGNLVQFSAVGFGSTSGVSLLIFSTHILIF
jgi:hypothetical protein